MKGWNKYCPVILCRKIFLLNKIKDRIATRKADYKALDFLSRFFVEMLVGCIGEFAAHTATAIAKMKTATFCTANAKSMGSCSGSSGGRYRGDGWDAVCKKADREADPRGGKARKQWGKAARDGGILLLPLKMLGFGDDVRARSMLICGSVNTIGIIID